MTTTPTTPVEEILISFLLAQGYTRERAVELVESDPQGNLELINSQILEAQTVLAQAALVPDK